MGGEREREGAGLEDIYQVKVENQMAGVRESYALWFIISQSWYKGFHASLCPVQILDLDKGSVGLLANGDTDRTLKELFSDASDTSLLISKSNALIQTTIWWFSECKYLITFFFLNILL